jgi:hypothetical protein
MDQFIQSKLDPFNHEKWRVDGYYIKRLFDGRSVYIARVFGDLGDDNFRERATLMANSPVMLRALALIADDCFFYENTGKGTCKSKGNDPKCWCHACIAYWAIMDATNQDT